MVGNAAAQCDGRPNIRSDQLYVQCNVSDLRSIQSTIVDADLVDSSIEPVCPSCAEFDEVGLQPEWIPRSHQRTIQIRSHVDRIAIEDYMMPFSGSHMHVNETVDTAVRGEGEVCART